MLKCFLKDKFSIFVLKEDMIRSAVTVLSIHYIVEMSVMINNHRVLTRVLQTALYLYA
jgi:hypothetical protein